GSTPSSASFESYLPGSRRKLLRVGRPVKPRCVYRRREPMRLIAGNSSSSRSRRVAVTSRTVVSQCPVRVGVGRLSCREDPTDSERRIPDAVQSNCCALYLPRHGSLQRRRVGAFRRSHAEGQLLSSASAQQSDPLLLAMGWYPTFAGTAPGSPVGAVITQANIELHGSFPVDFNFTLTGTPPAAALFDLSKTGGTGHLAYGVLIAFRDVNKNGLF